MRSESSNHSQWWTAFNDPILNTLVVDAYDQNLDLRTAGFRVFEARAQRAIVAGNLLPQSQQGLGDYYRRQTAERVGTPAPGQSFSVWAAGFNLAWELDFWGRFQRALEAADADLNASIENYDDVLVTLLADVGVTYVEIRTLQNRLEVARANVEAQRGAMRIAEARFNEGRTTKLDVFQAKNNLAQTEAVIPALEIALRRSGNRLCILCGIPPRDLQEELVTGPVPVPPAEVAVGIPADLLRRRPDVRRAERTLAAQSAKIGVATAELYPHIAITGTIGLEANDFADLFRSEAFTGSVGPSLRWSILNYGRVLSNIRVQDARFQQLATEYQIAVLRANEETENALVAFLKSRHGNILAGSFGQVKFTEAEGHAPLTLPGNTLLFRAEGPQVGVVKPDGTVALRSVKLGRDFGQTVEILGGVGPADRVILNPSDSLADGDSVRLEVEVTE